MWVTGHVTHYHRAKALEALEILKMTSVAIIHNHPIHYQHLLFCELAKTGLDFEVLFLSASSRARIQAPRAENGEYRFSIGYKGPHESAPALGTSRFVWRSLNRIRPDVVILCGWADSAMWAGWLWARAHGAARILWAESTSVDHPRSAWKEAPKRLFVRGCDAAHVYGTSSRAYLEQLGMAGEKICGKRAVVNTALFLNGGENEAGRSGPIRLLYCGRLSEEKNLAMLLRAFSELRQSIEAPKMILRLVGSGPLEQPLRLLATDLGIAGIVDFAGGVPQEGLPVIFRESDALILPSTREPWGLVVNEAMLSGLPVAVSERCGCVADLVKPENGWTFSPQSETELIELLANIASTPREVLAKMGRTGRTLAAEYSPENCAIAVIEMVHCLARDRRGGNFAVAVDD